MSERSLFHPRCRAWLEVVLDGRGAANSKPFHFEVDPRSASVGLNGFYEADTFSMEFDSKLLPFDPDQIAYVAARIYMWDSPRVFGKAEWSSERNLMIKGLVDDIESVVVGSDTLVKFSGRDYTAILIDAEWDPKQTVKAGGRLDEVVQRIADAAAPKESSARFLVEWRGQGRPPVVGGLQRDTKKKGMAVKPGKSYWEVIWDLCIQHAYVPRVEGSTIIVSEPMTETRESLLDVPRLVYGRTLTGLEIRRKFSRETVPQVIIVAYDPVTRKRIEVKFPAKKNIDQMTTAQRSQAVDALGIKLTAKKDEEMHFPAPKGVIDRDALERYARMRFYHLGRGETVYSMRTRHLSVPKREAEVRSVLSGVGFETEDNLLHLRPGQAIGITFDPFKVTTMRDLKTHGARVDFVKSLGYHHEVAFVIASNFDRMEFFKQNYYYNRGTVEYSLDDGIEVEIEAMNFAGEVKEIEFAEGSQAVAKRNAELRAQARSP